MKLFISKDIEELGLKVAEAFIREAKAAIENKGRFSVALAGGSTPVALYKRLSSPRFKDSIDWKRVEFFFGDERSVPPDDKDSNYAMALDSLFRPLGIEDRNIYRIRGELSSKEAALDYEERLKGFFPDYEARTFDLALLGLGSDCHTLSLFPGTAALNEKERLVVENISPKPVRNRITLTYKAVNVSEKVFFMVSGSDKASALKRVLKGDLGVMECPAKGVRPVTGEVSWYVDAEAASLLDKP